MESYLRNALFLVILLDPFEITEGEVGDGDFHLLNAQPLFYIIQIQLIALLYIH